MIRPAYFNRQLPSLIFYVVNILVTFWKWLTQPCLHVCRYASVRDGGGGGDHWVRPPPCNRSIHSIGLQFPGNIPSPSHSYVSCLPPSLNWWRQKNTPSAALTPQPPAGFQKPRLSRHFPTLHFSPGLTGDADSSLREREFTQRFFQYLLSYLPGTFYSEISALSLKFWFMNWRYFICTQRWINVQRHDHIVTKIGKWTSWII